MAQGRHTEDTRHQGADEDSFHCGKYRAKAAAHFPIDLLLVRSIIIDEMSELPRLSGAERLILELLMANDESFGLQMVELSGGRLKRGTVYVTLGRMIEKGYLESRQEPLPEGAIGLPRRLYRPTGLAMRVLAAWQAADASYLTGVGPQEA